MRKYLRFPELLLLIAIVSGLIIRPRTNSFEFLIHDTIYILNSATVMYVFAALLAFSWIIHIRMRKRPHYLDLTNWIHVAVTLGCWYELLFGKFVTPAMLLLPLAQILYWIAGIIAIARTLS